MLSNINITTNTYLLLQAQGVPYEVIEQTLAQLKSMGYQDEGGWLTELVKAKGGDIGKVLDALHPTDATISETD